MVHGRSHVPVSLILIDIDGVLTDGKLTYHEYGGTSRNFHARDRVALRQMAAVGWDIHLVSMSDWNGFRLWAKGLPVKLHLDNRKEKHDIEAITNGAAYHACADDPKDFYMLHGAERAFTPRDGFRGLEAIVPSIHRLHSGGGEGVIWDLLDLIGEAT